MDKYDVKAEQWIAKQPKVVVGEPKKRPVVVVPKEDKK